MGHCKLVKVSMRDKNKHPTAFSVLIRFWGTDQNTFSPINGLLEMPWKERMGCVYVGQRKSARLVKKKVAYNIRGVYTVQEH